MKQNEQDIEFSKMRLEMEELKKTVSELQRETHDANKEIIVINLKLKLNV